MQLNLISKFGDLVISAETEKESDRLTAIWEKLALETQTSFHVNFHPHSKDVHRISLMLEHADQEHPTGKDKEHRVPDPNPPKTRLLVESITREQWNEHIKRVGIESRQVLGDISTGREITASISHKELGDQDQQLTSDWLYISHARLGYFRIKFPKYSAG
jgi:hypothetical protein